MKHPAKKEGRHRHPALKDKWGGWLVGVANGCGFVAVVALPLYYLLGVVELGVVGGWLQVAVAVGGFGAVVLALVGFAGLMLAVGLYDRGVRLIKWVRQHNKKTK